MPPERRIAAGPIGAIPEDECRAVGDGSPAVVVRVGDRVLAYRNRCLHQDAPLDGGWVREGVLTCPLHFWRYRVGDGRHIGSDSALDSFPVDVVDGQVFVTVPDEPAPGSWRERLLARARDYDHDAEFQRRQRG